MVNVSPNEHPEHCAECGAYLSTQVDQDLHATWHQELFQALVDLNRAANVTYTLHTHNGPLT